MKPFARTFIAALVGVGLAAGPAVAAPSKTQSTTKEQAQPRDPHAVAKETVDEVLSRLEKNRATYKKNPDKLYAMIEEVLVPHVDTDYMAQLVLGRHWRSASEAQREQFIELFKNMVIQTYGNALLGFDDEKIEYLPIRAEDDATDITFRAEVTTDNGDTVPVTLDMHVVDGQWQVYNGSVGNLSFVTNYRGQFNAQIKAGGMSNLLDKLEKRYGDSGAANPDKSS